MLLLVLRGWLLFLLRPLGHRVKRQRHCCSALICLRCACVENEESLHVWCAWEWRDARRRAANAGASVSEGGEWK